MHKPSKPKRAGRRYAPLPTGWHPPTPVEDEIGEWRRVTHDANTQLQRAMTSFPASAAAALPNSSSSATVTAAAAPGNSASSSSVSPMKKEVKKDSHQPNHDHDGDGGHERDDENLLNNKERPTNNKQANNSQPSVLQSSSKTGGSLVSCPTISGAFDISGAGGCADLGRLRSAAGDFALRLRSFETNFPSAALTLQRAAALLTKATDSIVISALEKQRLLKQQAFSVAATAASEPRFMAIAQFRKECEKNTAIIDEIEKWKEHTGTMLDEHKKALFAKAQEAKERADKDFAELDKVIRNSTDLFDTHAQLTIDLAILQTIDKRVALLAEEGHKLTNQKAEILSSLTRQSAEMKQQKAVWEEEDDVMNNKDRMVQARAAAIGRKVSERQAIVDELEAQLKQVTSVNESYKKRIEAARKAFAKKEADALRLSTPRPWFTIKGVSRAGLNPSAVLDTVNLVPPSLIEEIEKAAAAAAEEEKERENNDNETQQSSPPEHSLPTLHPQSSHSLQSTASGLQPQLSALLPNSEDPQQQQQPTNATITGAAATAMGKKQTKEEENRNQLQKKQQHHHHLTLYHGDGTFGRGKPSTAAFADHLLKKLHAAAAQTKKAQEEIIRYTRIVAPICDVERQMQHWPGEEALTLSEALKTSKQGNSGGGGGGAVAITTTGSSGVGGNQATTTTQQQLHPSFQGLDGNHNTTTVADNSPSPRQKKSPSSGNSPPGKEKEGKQSSSSGNNISLSSKKLTSSSSPGASQHLHPTDNSTSSQQRHHRRRRRIGEGEENDVCYIGDGGADGEDEGEGSSSSSSSSSSSDFDEGSAAGNNTNSSTSAAVGSSTTAATSALEGLQLALSEEDEDDDNINRGDHSPSSPTFTTTSGGIRSAAGLARSASFANVLVKELPEFLQYQPPPSSTTTNNITTATGTGTTQTVIISGVTSPRTQQQQSSFFSSHSSPQLGGGGGVGTIGIGGGSGGSGFLAATPTTASAMNMPTTPTAASMLAATPSSGGVHNSNSSSHHHHPPQSLLPLPITNWTLPLTEQCAYLMLKALSNPTIVGHTPSSLVQLLLPSASAATATAGNNYNSSQASPSSASKRATTTGTGTNLLGRSTTTVSSSAVGDADGIGISLATAGLTTDAISYSGVEASLSSPLAAAVIATTTSTSLLSSVPPPPPPPIYEAAPHRLSEAVTKAAMHVFFCAPPTATTTAVVSPTTVSHHSNNTASSSVTSGAIDYYPHLVQLVASASRAAGYSSICDLFVTVIAGFAPLNFIDQPTLPLNKIIQNSSSQPDSVGLVPTKAILASLGKEYQKAGLGHLELLQARYSLYLDASTASGTGGVRVTLLPEVGDPNRRVGCFFRAIVHHLLSQQRHLLRTITGLVLQHAVVAEDTGTPVVSVSAVNAVVDRLRVDMTESMGPRGVKFGTDSRYVVLSGKSWTGPTQDLPRTSGIQRFPFSAKKFGLITSTSTAAGEGAQGKNSDQQQPSLRSGMTPTSTSLSPPSAAARRGTLFSSTTGGTLTSGVYSGPGAVIGGLKLSKEDQQKLAVVTAKDLVEAEHALLLVPLLNFKLSGGKE